MHESFTRHTRVAPVQVYKSYGFLFWKDALLITNTQLTRLFYNS